MLCIYNITFLAYSTYKFKNDKVTDSMDASSSEEEVVVVKEVKKKKKKIKIVWQWEEDLKAHKYKGTNCCYSLPLTC